MFNFDYLKTTLLIAIALSSITCTFVQKTKIYIKGSKNITLYSLLVNLAFSIIFCKSFTSIDIPNSLWIGLFSFLGADSIYKTLEGKLSTYTELIQRKEISISKENIINEEDK
ncbi:MAG: hypothetical protein IKF71_02520 [Bacilli bacterium]|nr:hypothetical protein [Bacilli bacterium]